MTTKTVKVPGISCGHCVSTIEREVGELKGVESVKAEQGSRQVTVSWDPDATDWVVIQDHLEEINYPPEA
ncbi:MAG: heavy-metal-associated domain-containing protein [Longimicrobiales bacterium]|nr:heavy-metal-associated domain-containing protein [Longimicrobiales bacterium]